MPPLRPTYIFLIKRNRNLQDEALTMPDIILTSRKCRYMIHIIAFNFKGKDRERIESQIKSYISSGLWITYNFLSDHQGENSKGPDELSGQYALLRVPQILHEYVGRTFLAFDSIPNTGYLCRAESENSLLNLRSVSQPSIQDSSQAFGADLGLDLGFVSGFVANGLFNEEMETRGVTTATNVASTISTRLGTKGRESLRWCIEVLYPLYYLDLDQLRMEKKRIEVSIKEEHIYSREIFKSECYQIPAINKDSTEEETDDDEDVVYDGGADSNDEYVGSGNHFDNQNKLYF